MANIRWSDLNSSQKGAITAVGTVEVLLTVAAWRDLATRPASEVRGPKQVWALVVLVQPVGPIAYFAVGRR